MSYSLDLREKVLSYVEDVGNLTKASEIFKVSRNAIYKWQRLKEEKGRPVDNAPNRSFKKLDPEQLKAYVLVHADKTLKEYADHFKVYPHAITRVFARLKITRKKRLASIKRETKRKEQYFWSQ